MAIKRDKTREYLQNAMGQTTSSDPEPGLTHQRIVELLIAHYHKDERQWISVPEMRIGTGYGKIANRQIDLFAINCYPSKGHKTIAYEVKVSRGDFKRDVRKPEKQRGARLYANEVYYVTPAGLLNPDDIPLWAGLIEVAPGKSPGRFCFNKVREPVPSERIRPNWSFICSLLRRLPDEE